MEYILSPSLLACDFSDIEEELQQLEEAGVTYAALPGFTSAEDIEQTVQLLGDLLGDTSGDGGTNAPEIAQAYIDWCDSIESELSGAETTAATTVFIEDWDEDVQIEYGVQEWIDTGAHRVTGRIPAAPSWPTPGRRSSALAACSGL